MKKNKMLLVFFAFCSLSLFAQEKSEDVFLPLKNKFASFNEALDLVKQAEVVYVGETHDQKACHDVQLQALKALAEAKNFKAAVGFEMLNLTLQPVLDEFMEGRIEEAEFLEKINWKKEWGFDYALYKPIFDYARENKLKALALNVPRKIVSKTARGGIKALDEKERALAAKKIKVPKNKKYRNYLKQTYGGHGENPMNKIMTFENYELSMAVWNESMGERVADFLNENKGYGFLVVAGNGHMMYNAAIPNSVMKRTKKLRHISIYTENMENKAEYLKSKEHLSDLVWFVPYVKKEESK